MSSSSDRDKDSSGSPSKRENPFIRFRQFADSQISALLQGIVGLPSAFSKNQSENTRWADFDTDLRRRDELQAKQRELAESEARRSDTQASKQEEEENPVQRYPVQHAASSASPASSDTVSNRSKTEDLGERDVPLYSPVTKALFAHLNVPGGDKPDWTYQAQPTSVLPLRMQDAIYAHSFWVQNDGTSPLKMIQYWVYNAVNHDARLRPSNSLLPYLLFSPYSPLKLSLMPQSNSPPDNFPYREAFEDLILTSQGHPLMSQWSQTTEKSVFRAPHDVSKAINGMRWLTSLHSFDLLQPLEPPKQIWRPATTSAVSSRTPNPSQVMSDRSSPQGESLNKEAQTEQEMYDRFLRWASSPIVAAAGLESLLADTEEFIQQQLKTFENTSERIVQKEPRESKSRSVPEAASEPDKVVWTSTTSEQTTHEDGSVETSVTVSKRFADGRETVTTTIHSVDRARDENGRPMVPLEPAKAPSEEEQSKKESGKKGWFWN